jgi:hypothetical protein
VIEPVAHTQDGEWGPISLARPAGPVSPGLGYLRPPALPDHLYPLASSRSLTLGAGMRRTFDVEALHCPSYAEVAPLTCLTRWP